MSRVYKTSGVLNVSTAADIIQLTCGAQKICEIIRFTLEGLTETDDSTRIIANRATTTGNTGGTPITPRPVDPGDAAASATLQEGFTVAATGLSEIDLWKFSALGGVISIWTPDEEMILGGTDILVISSLDTINAIDLIWKLTFREKG